MIPFAPYTGLFLSGTIACRLPIVNSTRYYTGITDMMINKRTDRSILSHRFLTMFSANESAKCKQGEHDTRRGNQEVASSEYHIERGFGPVKW
jgi:hypothetical protein